MALPTNNLNVPALRRAAGTCLRAARAFLRRLPYGLTYAFDRPAPREAKVRAVCDYGREYGIGCLIETGTYQGDMVAACLTSFPRIISIELFGPLHEEACRRFAGTPSVTLIQGNSGQLLPEILAAVSEPCLFWLDGHYSGPGTGRGPQDTPVLAELECILSHPQKGHVILIDDARLFIGRQGYPKAGGVRAIAEAAGRKFQRKQDIIRITPVSGH